MKYAIVDLEGPALGVGDTEHEAKADALHWYGGVDGDGSGGDWSAAALLEISDESAAKILAGDIDAWIEDEDEFASDAPRLTNEDFAGISPAEFEGWSKSSGWCHGWA